MRAYESESEQHSFAAVLGLPNLHKKTVHSFDVGHTLVPNTELERIPRHPAFSEDSAHATAQVFSYAKIFQLSGDSVLENDTDSIANLLRSVAVLGVQLEASLLAGVIDGAPVLSDGAVFDASNTLAQALSLENLGAAVGLLRNQGAPGHPLNLAPRHIVVAPGLEMLARKLVHDCGMSDTIKVAVLPGLTAGRWALLANPQSMPSLSLYHITGARSAMSLQASRNFNSDGIDFRVNLKTGAGFAGRIGVVRCGSDLV